MPYVIASAEFLISAETSTLHIASIVGTKTLCISNGSFYKRFQPIPSNKINYVYPDKFESEIPSLSEEKEKANKYYTYKTPYKTQYITPEKVITKFMEIYK